MGKITYDGRSMIIDGKRQLLISGAIHYPRSTPAMWPKLFAESRRAGLNCVETYVFWEGHEPQEGEYNFTGRFDLRRFLQEAQKAGLYVILRIGPYVCAEWNFGGLAWWLLTKNGMQTRTWNQAFMDAMSRWVRVLMQEIGDLQYTQGGPIILAQMENEYANIARTTGDAGQRYLQWTAKLARQAGIDVPMIMCEGASDDVIETLNGFSVWRRAEALPQHRPGQPLLWTENWPAWYDTWGYAHHVRTPEDIAYEVTRFVGVGGTGVNYYMWHGGTNFERDAMFLQTTSYDFDAPLDEYGLPTAKSQQLKLMHQFMQRHADFLLQGERLPKEVLHAGENGEDVILYPYRHGKQVLTIVVNGTREKSKVTVGTATPELLPRSAAAVLQTGDRARVVYQTTKRPAKPIRRRFVTLPVELSWKALPEPLPGTGLDDARDFIEVRLPHNMLPETADESDYGWYRTTVHSTTARIARLTTRVEDLLSVWVNGESAGAVPERLDENRTKPGLFAVAVDIPLRKGQNELLLQVAALGLIKHDCQLGKPQQTEIKGFRSAVSLDGKPLRQTWEFSPGLWGEIVCLADPDISRLAPWRPLPKTAEPQCWYRSEFQLTERQLADPRPWALTADGLDKGMLWVNGQGLGRYWQVLPKPAAPVDPWQYPHVHLEPSERPPQEYYHIPADWLVVGRNTIVVFAERGGDPRKLKLVHRQ